jgi:aspartyl-tRNA(Asn)/glutamyl-tRNA(Gln) amidotransferase subunit C
MKITLEQVRYVAALANLDLSEPETARMTHDLDEILTYMDKLNELDTSGVEPMAQVLCAGAGEVGLREDQPGATLSNAEALSNAPLAGAGQFKVPKIIER